MTPRMRDTFEYAGRGALACAVLGAMVGGGAWLAGASPIRALWLAAALPGVLLLGVGILWLVLTILLLALTRLKKRTSARS